MTATLLINSIFSKTFLIKSICFKFADILSKQIRTKQCDRIQILKVRYFFYHFTVLALKQISKPIANVLKARAKNSPFFRKYICMPPAQFYNYVEVKTKMLALNLGKPTAVPKLTEAMAIELGANLLGEVVIFAIGAGILM